MINRLESVLIKHRLAFGRVVDFDALKDKLLHFNFSKENKELTDDLISYTKQFSWYINKKLESGNYRYGIGGYNEDRILYKRSEHFTGTEQRSVHLGIDIWGPAGTNIYVPLGGTVHSVGFNNNFGDYGATIILQHQLDTISFHTLYGHVSSNDIIHFQEGKYISRGELLAHFGEPAENGDWPPHLHFQVIEDMHEKKGDYPGVCSVSEREKYLHNCPDPDIILNMMNKIQ